MIERLRNRLLDLLDELSARRAARSVKPRGRIGGTAVKGNMRNVIVVHPRSDIFQEAVFVLKDDYFQSPGVSREALLRQARAAAEEYTLSAAPPENKSALPAAPLLIVCAAAAVILLILCAAGAI